MVKALSAMKSQEEALAKARRFAMRVKARCEELGLRFIKSYLIGSRARGDYTVDSDIDVVVVVDGVRGLNPIDRIRLFKDLIEPGIEPRVYDVSEWLDEENLWIRELKKEAVEIA